MAKSKTNSSENKTAKTKNKSKKGEISNGTTDSSNHSNAAEDNVTKDEKAEETVVQIRDEKEQEVEESKRSEHNNSDEIKQDDNALLVKSYEDDDPLPSVVSVLFYTLILPICIIVAYGHYYSDDFINASSSPDSVPVHPVKTQMKQRDPAPIITTSSSQNVPSPKESFPEVAPVGIDTEITSGTAYRNVSSEEDFLRSWKIIRTKRLRRYENDPRLTNKKEVNDLRISVKKNPSDGNALFKLAVELSNRDRAVSDGGSEVEEILLISERAIHVMSHEIKTGNSMKEYQMMTCLLQYRVGLVKYTSNRFLDSVDSYSRVLELGFCEKAQEFNAIESRASSYLVLSQYDKAVDDALFLLENDSIYLFSSAVSVLVRVVNVKEQYVPGGWDFIMSKVDELITIWEDVEKRSIADSEKLHALHHLQRLYRATYHYLEKKKEYLGAFNFLTRSNDLKFRLNPIQYRPDRSVQLKQVFTTGFFDVLKMSGEPSVLPIFIVGMPRSGSTLLESVLDAHPSIAGLSEDSVLNGRIAKVQTEVHSAIGTNRLESVASAISKNANEIKKGMFERWERMSSDSFFKGDAKSRQKPLRLVDKQLGNIYNVGFIHMLFPNAVIFHVSRESMDTIFSNYKHDFTGLEDTNNIDTLTNSFKEYRTMVEHWDRVLPGRMYHIRYEEMVHDFEAIARAVISATGLPWHDSILSFNKRKQATNTYSSTQVREKVYTGSIHSWKKYEKQLKPFVDKIGRYSLNTITTKLPGYSGYKGPQW